MQYELKEVLVSVKNVSLQFEDKVILKPTSIEVRDIVRPDVAQGQVVGILGPSGVGKTQFSRILTGLQTPSSGTVEILIGDKMVTVPPGQIGMVAQHYPLLRHRTVMGNLLVALEHSALDPKARTAKAQEHLALFEMADKADLYPSQLSGGQRQRVAILQSLLCSEHYMVMDEPFTGLDPIMKDRVCELINKVATLHERNTIFVVAHDIEALLMIADCLWLFGREPGVPGATIKHQYNLIERGLAWRPGLSSTREFADLRNEVKEKFSNL